MHSEAKTPPKDVHLSNGAVPVKSAASLRGIIKEREVVLMSYKEEYQKETR